MGLRCQTPSHHPGGVWQRKLHQLQCCGMTASEVKVPRGNSPHDHCTSSPQGLAQPRAPRWDGCLTIHEGCALGWGRPTGFFDAWG